MTPQNNDVSGLSMRSSSPYFTLDHLSRFGQYSDTVSTSIRWKLCVTNFPPKYEARRLLIGGILYQPLCMGYQRKINLVINQELQSINIQWDKCSFLRYNTNLEHICQRIHYKSMRIIGIATDNTLWIHAIMTNMFTTTKKYIVDLWKE